MIGPRARRAASAAVAAALLAYPASRVVRSTRMTHGGVSAFVRLLDAANAGDLDAADRLCSARYLAAHRLGLARGGGIVGLPRNIHRNFRAWAEGDEVRVCPTDRVGPVYRLVLEGGSWKFAGLAGLLGPRGIVEPEPE